MFRENWFIYEESLMRSLISKLMLESRLFRLRLHRFEPPGHKFGDEVRLQSKFLSKLVLIPAYTDVEIVINSAERINFPNFQPNDKDPEVVLTKENLHSYEKDLNVYIFRKKNSAELSSVLPLNEISRIPKIIGKTYIERIPQDMYTLARKLYEGNDTVTAIETFYDFVHRHLRRKSPTTRKKLNKLLKEYRNSGYFYGNCKEACDFFAGLCYTKELPVRKISGKTLYSERGHVWDEVCVPTDGGYEWVPVDAIKGYFNNLSDKHFFISRIPSIFTRNAIVNWFLRRPNELTLKVDSLS